MEFMDFVLCSKNRSVKSCCGKKGTMVNEDETDDCNNENLVLSTRKHRLGNIQPLLTSETVSSNAQNERYDDSSKAAPWTGNQRSSVYQPSSELSCNRKDQSSESVQEETFSSLQTGEERNFRCPRCGKRMQEPRLLPCLHPMCSPCVSELMSKPFCNSSRDRLHEDQQRGRNCDFYETCPLCDFRLPDANSTVPPPHYPLQHRLVMDAIRCRLANKVLCDACPDEVVALVQCSTCLRNFCSDCGMEHQQEVTMELRPAKHLIRPLWEATKVRRTALCQKHPTHALRFYCIACQQVTCKECMWSLQHRGHASENATGAGRRAALYLTTMLQRAKVLLNSLLTQYDRDAFANSTLEELQEAFASTEPRDFSPLV